MEIIQKLKMGITLISFLFSSMGFSSIHQKKIEGVDLLSSRKIEIPFESKVGTVLLFLSAHCPCSMSHEPIIKKLAEDFKGFRFFAIHSNQNETEDETKKHFIQANLGFPILQDEGAEIADHFGALKTPHSFILNSQGQIVFQGGIDESQNAENAKKPYLRWALEALSHGQLPPESKVRTLGCIIQRSK